jgi:hypothetical protein
MHTDPNLLKEDFTSYPHDLIKSYKIIFTDKIIDNICARHQDDESFSLDVFTIDGIITEIEFIKLVDPKMELKYSSTHFVKNLNISCVEYLYASDLETYYALGSTNGTIYIGILSQNKLAGLSFNIVSEIRAKTLTEKLTSFIPLSILKHESNEVILAIKYIGNNLIAYVTSYFMFKLYNIRDRRETYSECLIKNRTNQILNYSRIEYLTINLQEGMEPRSKSFLFALYLEYDVIFCINTFEIIFTNIPSSNIDNSAFISNFTTYFNTIDLGSNLFKKNSNMHKLEGRLIDLRSYDNKLWIVSEKNQKVKRLFGAGEQIFTGYEIKLFNRSGDQAPKSEIVISNEKIKNYHNIILQLLLGKNSNENKNEIVKSLFNNPDIYDNSLTDSNYFLNLRKSLLTKLENRIDACDFFLTEDLNSLCFIRNKSLSFIKYGSEFDTINVAINKHEYYLRNMLFEDSYYSLSEKSTGEHDISTMISRYIGIEKNKDGDNLFYIILALLRIYMTELNILMDDVEHVSKYFNLRWNNYNTFVKEYFIDALGNQFNNLNHLDVFHQVIYDICLNNIGYIDDHIQGLIKLFETYSKERNVDDLTSLITTMYVENSEFVNPKFCEILSKMASEKITSIYHLSRDLFAFLQWKEQNLSYDISLENMNLYNNKIIVNFKDYYSLYLIANSKVKAVEKGTNMLEIIVHDNLNKFGGSILADIKNKYVDYIIFYMTRDFIYNSNAAVARNRRDYYNIIHKLLNLGQNDVLSTVVKIQTDLVSSDYKQLEQCFVQIISLVMMKDNEDWKEYINKYFTILIDIQNNNGNGFTYFENFYCYFTGNDTIAAEANQDYVIIKGYYYLNEELSKYLNTNHDKFEFYNLCYTRIFQTFTKNDSPNKMKIINEYIVNLIRYALTVGFDVAYNYYLNTRDKLNINSHNHFIVELFSIYLLNNYKPIHLKIISKDNNLCDLLCSHLEEKAKSLFNSIGNIMNIIDVHYNYHTISSEYNEGRVYKMLLNIYEIRGENDRAIKIYYKLYECVNSLLGENIQWKAEDLLQAYKFKLKVLEDLTYFIKLTRENFDTGYIDDIKPYNKLLAEKEMTTARLEFLNFVVSEKKILQGDISNDQVLLSELFKYQMYNLITDYNMISCIENDSLKHILIYNFIADNFAAPGETIQDGMSKLGIDGNHNLPYSYKKYKDINLLSVFYQQVCDTNDIDLVRVSLESLLSLYNEAAIPGILVIIFLMLEG